MAGLKTAAHTERHESYLSSHTFHSFLFNLITLFQGLSVRLFTAAYLSVPRPCLPSLPTSRFDSKPQARLRHLKPRWPPVTQSAVTCRLTPSVFSTAVSLFSTKKHRLIFGVSKTTLWKNRRQLSKFILVEWAFKHVGTVLWGEKTISGKIIKIRKILIPGWPVSLSRKKLGFWSSSRETKNR